ncbi:MAG: hypothetical protein D3908_00305 [Candidatus Electrothrix sp. AUS4]|nr:hypothetical protein [Candidatus Electrothrix sp. AUS4]
MKKFLAACVVPMSILTACAGNQTKSPLSVPSLEEKKPLDKVEVNYPVNFALLSGGRTLGKVFPPPKTIDCSGLALKPDAFEDAIEAGALTLRIQTQRQVKRRVIDKNGNETTEFVQIKPVYGGVLALCNVSERAIGLDSRSYNIRGLDDYLIMGRDGKVSVIGAQLKYEESGPNIFGNMIESKMNTLESKLGNFGITDLFKGSGSGDYSWMLWLTDRTTTFSNYEAEVKRRRQKAEADKWRREREAKKAAREKGAAASK